MSKINTEDGYIVPLGQTLSKSEYPDLYKALEKSYGRGVGMSKINTVDAIQYLETVCFELLHSEERLTQIGSSTFRNLELNDNLQLVINYMKFAIDRKMEIGQKKKIDTKLEYWEDE